MLNIIGLIVGLIIWYFFYKHFPKTYLVFSVTSAAIIFLSFGVFYIITQEFALLYYSIVAAAILLGFYFKRNKFKNEFETKNQKS